MNLYEIFKLVLPTLTSGIFKAHESKFREDIDKIVENLFNSDQHKPSFENPDDLLKQIETLYSFFRTKISPTLNQPFGEEIDILRKDGERQYDDFINERIPNIKHEIAIFAATVISDIFKKVIEKGEEHFNDDTKKRIASYTESITQDVKKEADSRNEYMETTFKKINQYYSQRIKVGDLITSNKHTQIVTDVNYETGMVTTVQMFMRGVCKSTEPAMSFSWLSIIRPNTTDEIKQRAVAIANEIANKPAEKMKYGLKPYIFSSISNLNNKYWYCTQLCYAAYDNAGYVPKEFSGRAPIYVTANDLKKFGPVTRIREENEPYFHPNHIEKATQLRSQINDIKEKSLETFKESYTRTMFNSVNKQIEGEISRLERNINESKGLRAFLKCGQWHEEVMQRQRILQWREKSVKALEDNFLKQAYEIENANLQTLFNAWKKHNERNELIERKINDVNTNDEDRQIIANDWIMHSCFEEMICKRIQVLSPNIENDEQAKQILTEKTSVEQQRAFIETNKTKLLERARYIDSHTIEEKERGLIQGYISNLDELALTGVSEESITCGTLETRTELPPAWTCPPTRYDLFMQDIERQAEANGLHYIEATKPRCFPLAYVAVVGFRENDEVGSCEYRFV